MGAARTRKLCPAVIGQYDVYTDRFHVTTAYTERLLPVLAAAIGLKK